MPDHSIPQAPEPCVGNHGLLIQSTFRLRYKSGRAIALRSADREKAGNMGGFFLALGKHAAQTAALADNAAPQFARSGLGAATRITDPAYVLDHYAKHEQETTNLVHLAGSDFIASVGTVIYKRQTGAAALQLLAAERDLASAIGECAGDFALIIRRLGKTAIVRDSLSSYQIYYNEDLTIFSTSFLALARCLPKCTMRVPECIEYVVWATTFGAGTPVKEIRRLDLGEAVTIESAARITSRMTISAPPESPASFSDQLALVLGAARDYIRDITAAFDGKVKLSFSGGYDSRLVLALLRTQGITPSAFVYGGDDSLDVRVARTIAASESVPLEVVSKERFRPVTLETFPNMIDRNYNWFDGFYNMGFFWSDAEALLLEKRSRPPGVVLTGRCGESFRNFYRLPDRGISVLGFVRSVGQLDWRSLKIRSLADLYERNLTAKIEALFGLNGSRLDRRQVAALYPYFRSQSWHARAISIDNRFGDHAQPFHYRRVAEATLRVPTKWKDFGNFEAAMIRKVDPKIAQYVSSYGYNFATGTPLKGRLNDYVLYALPSALRRYNFLARRLVSGRPRLPVLLTKPFLASVIDTEFPIMGRFFDPDRMTNVASFHRLANLEYMFERLNAQVEQPELQSVH